MGTGEGVGMLAYTLGSGLMYKIWRHFHLKTMSSVSDRCFWYPCSGLSVVARSSYSFVIGSLFASLPWSSVNSFGARTQFLQPSHSGWPDARHLVGAHEMFAEVNE